MNYKTPGVYVEEIVKFPPSVAQVETAIPAFIGYTQKGPKDEPTRISSLMEYVTLFGGADLEKDTFKISIADDVATVTIDEAKISKFKMYYALQMYFANGGGPWNRFNSTIDVLECCRRISGKMGCVRI